MSAARIYLGVSLLLISLISCEVEKPEVLGIKNFEIAKVHLISQDLEVHYDVIIRHPHAISVTLDEIYTRLYLDGRDMGDCLTPEGVLLTGNDTSMVAITQRIDTRNLVRTIRSYKGQKSVLLRLEMEVRIHESMEHWTLPYVYEYEANVEEELWRAISSMR